MTEKLKKISDLLKALISIAFTGKIIIHMNQGRVCKAEKHESIKL